MEIFSRKNRPRLFAAVALVAVALVWSFQGGAHVPTDSGLEATVSEPDAVEDQAVAEASTRADDSPVAVAVPPTEAEEEPHGAVKHFKALTRYPVSTRRIDETSHDLLNPNTRHERRGRLPGGKDDDLGWEVLYTADRYFVRGTESALISLQLWHDDEVVTPENVTMMAEAFDEDGQALATPLAVESDDDGAATLFVPNDQWPELVGRIKVTTTFSAEDLDPQTGHLDLYFTGESRIPAEFNGRFGDQAVGGDLRIDVGLDVRTPGRYLVEGNLYDSSNRPFGYARFDGSLDKGSQTASLRFFGLLFHDAEAEPPYTLGELRGRRVRPFDMPDREDMPAWPGRYTTSGPYDLSEFAEAEHDSPRRQRMLAMYQDAIDRGVRLTDPEYVNAADSR